MALPDWGGFQYSDLLPCGNGPLFLTRWLMLRMDVTHDSLEQINYFILN